MEHVGDAYLIYDQSGRIVDADHQACEILGRTREELIGSKVQEIGLEVIRPEMSVSWTRPLEAERFTFEARRVKGDGSVVPVGITLSVLGSPGGQTYTASIRDFTQRGQRDEPFGQLIDTLSDAAYVIDFNGKFLDVNHRAVEVLGYSRAELLGMGPADIDPFLTRNEISTLIEGMGLGERQLFPTQHKTKDGMVIPVEISSSLVPYQGKAAILSIARDMTDHTRSEMMMQARLRLLELAPATTVMGFLEATLDELETLTDSRIGFCNFVEGDGETLTPQAWSTRTRRDFCRTGQGRKLRVSEAGVWADAIRERRAILHNDFAAVPNRKGMPPGHATVDRELVVPVFRNDRVVAVFAVGNKQRPYVERDVEIVSSLADLAWDIAGRKQAEADLRKSEERLRQSQKMESVGRLAGGVAHDFNNMLGVILGHADLAMAQLDPQQPVHAHLKEIRDAAERSAGIAQQLLAFARRQTATPTLLDLNKSVGKMVDMLRRLIGEDIELVWSPGSDLGTVELDPSQLDQVLVNLCANARDAIVDGGKVVVETAAASLDTMFCAQHEGCVAGEYTVLSVSDNGTGMDEGTLEHVFEPFFSTKETGQGTGLGLATVYGIVKQNNGFIDVQSRLGQGSDVRIYFPRHGEPAAEEAAKHTPTTSRRGGETLLVVEDEPLVLRLAERILKSLGYKVLTAATPADALRVAEACEGTIDLLVTDVVMPEMNGWSLAERLLAARPDLKTLYVSGYPAEIISGQGLLEKGVRFLQKPFAPQDLAGAVRGALDEE